MESVSNLQEQINLMHHRVESQMVALRFLETALAEEAETIFRQQQVALLDALRERIVQEVCREEQREASANSAFCGAKFRGGFIRFASDIVVKKVIKPTGTVSYASAAKKAVEVWQQTAPFGTVMVQVSLGGIPNDIRVVSVSRIAREQGIPEQQVMTGLTAEGYYRLLPLEAFLDELGRLRQRVLEGELSILHR